MKTKIIRTRYAPSPTGYFHIGGARTALFNFLFAKANNGIFVVRIEDTDIERNVENGIESQLNNLKWLKIFPDESFMNPGLFGPYIQSEKLPRYKKLAEELLEQGKAYRCFCSPEDLEKERQERKQKGETPKYSKRCLHLSESEIERKIMNKEPYSIRLKLEPNKNYGWDDIVRGDISFNTNSMSDLVILKSNGIPTYNFAVVVDDYDMEISHVLRGEEHISNTPYQLAIKEALDLDNDIQYGHLSVIIDETGKKLSKRNQTLKQFIEDYKNMGFPEAAVTNFLCLLGWSRPDNKEIYSLIEAQKDFDIKNVSASPTTFDYEKMLWVSSQYFKAMDEQKYLSFVEPFVNCDIPRYKEVKDDCLLIFKNQISYASQLDELIEDLLKERDIDMAFVEESSLFRTEGIISVINNFKNSIEKLEKWECDSIHELIKECQVKSGLKGKDFFQPIRYAISFRDHGPELFRVAYILGKERVLNNIKELISKLDFIFQDECLYNK